MQVKALTVQHPIHAKAVLKISQCPRLAALLTAGSRSPTERIGAIDECKRGENCARLAECEMSTGNSAPFRGIIHARQVVEQ